MSTKYRDAYVVEPGFDFEPLYEVADNIIYLTSGFEKSLSHLHQSIRKALESFDPQVDILVPVGKVLAVMVATDLLAEYTVLNVAVYSDRRYEVVDLHSVAEGKQSGPKEPDSK